MTQLYEDLIEIMRIAYKYKDYDIRESTLHHMDVIWEAWQESVQKYIYERMNERYLKSI